MKNNFFKKIINNNLLVFTAIIIILFFAYDYHKNTFYRPQSVHTWRQTDCASQAYNYYKNDKNFFRPEIFLQCSDDYTTGYCAEEFPIIFYIVAILYSIFGFHEYIYRIFSLLVFILGLFYLLKFHETILKQKFWAIILTFLLFTSPVFAFYANNFITNSHAFAISLVAWFFFFKFTENRKNYFFLLSISLFTIAALIKISELFGLFTIGGLVFLEILRFLKLGKDNYLFKNKIVSLLLVSIGILIVASWYLYAHYYNEIHDQRYYVFRTGDIFSMTKDQIKLTYNYIRDIHFYRYFHWSVLVLLVLSIIWNFWNFRRADKLLLSITSIIFIGFVLYILLFFDYLREHDYYTISLYVLPIFSFILSFKLLLSKFPNFFKSKYIKLLASIYFVFLVWYAANKNYERYFGWENDVYRQFLGFYNIEPYLNEIGIGIDEKVISIPDASPNISLYLMNRKGYTNLLGNNPKVILLGISKGAKYLIVRGEETLNDEFVKQHTYHQIGLYKDISIFKLDGIKKEPLDKSFKMKELFWDLETNTSDKKYSISDTLYQLLECRGLDSSKAFSGRKSVRLEKDNYSLIFYINEVTKNNTFEVSVKRYRNSDCEAVLVAIISNPNDFYMSTNTPIRRYDNGWEELTLKFKVPEKLDKKLLQVYVWSPKCEEVYFDDMRITEIKTEVKQYQQ